MPRFRKKPIVIEAVLWEGTKQSFDAILSMGNVPWDPGPMGSKTFYIKTVDGNRATITPGTWVCKGVKGEFYPCQPDIFAETYERVEAPNPRADGPPSGGPKSSA